MDRIETMYSRDTIAGSSILDRNKGHWDFAAVPSRANGFSTL